MSATLKNSVVRFRTDRSLPVELNTGDVVSFTLVGNENLEIGLDIYPQVDGPELIGKNFEPDKIYGDDQYFDVGISGNQLTEERAVRLLEEVCRMAEVEFEEVRVELQVL